MKRTFTTTLVGAAAVLALVASTGCKKEEGAAGGAAGAGQGGVPAKTGFAVFPASSKFVFGLNLDSVRASSLYATYKPQLDALMSQGEMAKLKTACGFDPLAAIHTVVIGGDPQTKDVVVVAKGITRAQARTCAEKMGAAENKKVSVTDEGNLTMYQEESDSAWAAWLDDSTVVFSPDKDKTYVTQRVAGTAGLAEGAELMGLLKSVDTGATLYVAATLDALGPSNPAAAMAPGAKSFYASLKLGEGLDVDAGVRFDTPENAKSFTTTMQSQMTAMKGNQVPPQMAGLVKVMERVQIKQNANDMIVQLKLTKQELQELTAFVQQILQSFGGQLGGAAPQ
jgi:hypothetical protein